MDPVTKAVFESFEEDLERARRERDAAEAARDREKRRADEAAAGAAAMRESRQHLAQLIEDAFLAAQRDEDADGFITAYHFKTGWPHRLIAAARDAPSVDVGRSFLAEHARLREREAGLTTALVEIEADLAREVEIFEQRKRTSNVVGMSICEPSLRVARAALDAAATKGAGE